MIFIAQIDSMTDGISFIMNSLKLKFDANEWLRKIKYSEKITIKS
jgi:hypothetical protein